MERAWAREESDLSSAAYHAAALPLCYAPGPGGRTRTVARLVQSQRVFAGEPPEECSRGGIRTRTGAVFKAAVSPDWTTHEITINRRLVPTSKGLATVVGAGGVEPLVGRL